MENEKISAEKVYTLIDSMRRELKADIMRVEQKFDTMEAGRLTLAEVKMARVEADLSIVKKVVYGLMGAVGLTVLYALIKMVVK